MITRKQIVMNAVKGAALGVALAATYLAVMTSVIDYFMRIGVL